jgi:hypothetical protein
MNNIEEFDVPEYEYVQREWNDDEEYWESIEEAMYCKYYYQLFPTELFPYQEYCWLKELRRLRIILNAKDKEYDPEDSFENLDAAIDSLVDSQSDAELQIRNWLIQLKNARETVTNFQYNGDQYDSK